MDVLSPLYFCRLDMSPKIGETATNLITNDRYDHFHGHPSRVPAVCLFGSETSLMVLEVEYGSNLPRYVSKILGISFYIPRTILSQKNCKPKLSSNKYHDMIDKFEKVYHGTAIRINTRSHIPSLQLPPKNVFFPQFPGSQADY